MSERTRFLWIGSKQTLEWSSHLVIYLTSTKDRRSKLKKYAMQSDPIALEPTKNLPLPI